MTHQPKTEGEKYRKEFADENGGITVVFFSDTFYLNKYAHWLESRLATVEKEKDLAIAHDRQPYPTADAYETVCRVLEIVKKEREELRESKEFYKRRCDALQAIQKNMQEPERTAVCDILANGCIDLAVRPALASLTRKEQ